IYLSPDAKRFYPKGNLASHIIGHVNVDGAGLEGVERQYDRYLNAKAEETYVERDAKGNELSEGTRKEIRGNNVVLTIDEGLQFILEKKLDAAVEQWKADSATAIMMDPYTGEILAMASRPTYDANEPGSVKAAQRRNRGITDCYEPGSTFKIIVGTAALEERVVKPDMKFDCSAGNVEVGGRKIKDAHRHGVLTFKEVIQKSSNVGSIKIGLLLGKEKVYEYIKKYGFGEKTGIDLMGEVSGWVRTPEKWSGMSIGAISIGQEIAVTPLQVLRAYSVIANGGFLVKPHVVAEVFSPDGKLLYEAAPETMRIISEKNANIFKDILKTVTIEGGTATQAAVNGNEVAGKTGTAQKMDPVTKRYSRDRFISSFVGFVPAGDPRIAMIIIINEPRGQIYGGVVAAPVFRDIANEALSYLRIPRDDSQEKGLHLVSSK
ncbi:MAG TPA: penicillin-binding protein 2, partial [Dissulfurispiraceae bacterium]|nr:penicillin-binding protein 2 [Dissulfurispiraceae bacterium]